jgi:hypothetical protein
MSTLRLTSISNQGGTASVPSDTVINGTAKAWVNFNGTGTVAIRTSFNVSSITDGGTGIYTVNFTNAMPDANYVISVQSGNINSLILTSAPDSSVPTASAFTMVTLNSVYSLVDVTYGNAAIFR